MDFHIEKLQALVNHIQRQQPDLLFFPSIGMIPATFALSNLRIAPLQVFGIGHPAPSGSDCIDALVTLRDLVSPEGTWLDRPVTFTDHPLVLGSYRAESYRSAAEFVVRRPATEVLTIGINAAYMKLNGEFLAAVRRVDEQVQGEHRLMFFPNLEGIFHFAAEREILTQFPAAQVMPRADYGTYVTQLAECDLILQTFPFGGTNSTTDALALGLPVVCLDGAELHSTIDAHILRLLGQAVDLLAETPEQWTALAVRLANDPVLRRRVGEGCRRAFMEYMERAGGGRRDFADALMALAGEPTERGLV